MLRKKLLVISIKSEPDSPHFQLDVAAEIPIVVLQPHGNLYALYVVGLSFVEFVYNDIKTTNSVNVISTQS